MESVDGRELERKEEKGKGNGKVCASSREDWERAVVDEVDGVVVEVERAVSRNVAKTAWRSSF